MKAISATYFQRRNVSVPSLSVAYWASRGREMKLACDRSNCVKRERYWGWPVSISSGYGESHRANRRIAALLCVLRLVVCVPEEACMGLVWLHSGVFIGRWSYYRRRETIQ